MHTIKNLIIKLEAQVPVLLTCYWLLKIYLTSPFMPISSEINCQVWTLAVFYS